MHVQPTIQYHTKNRADLPDNGGRPRLASTRYTFNRHGSLTMPQVIMAFVETLFEFAQASGYYEQDGVDLDADVANLKARMATLEFTEPDDATTTS